MREIQRYLRTSILCVPSMCTCTLYVPTSGSTQNRSFAPFAGTRAQLGGSRKPTGTCRLGPFAETTATSHVENSFMQLRRTKEHLFFNPRSRKVPGPRETKQINLLIQTRNLGQIMTARVIFFSTASLPDDSVFTHGESIRWPSPVTIDHPRQVSNLRLRQSIRRQPTRCEL